MPFAEAAPLTRSAFAPYGDVVEVAGTACFPANDGRALRYDQPIDLRHDAQAQEALFSLYSIEASTLPHTVDHLERHPASCQVFIPMNAERYLIAVAGAGARGTPDAASLRVFIATASQGVCYSPGVWHYPLVSLDRPGTFAMFMWRAAEATQDCETQTLEQSIEVRP